MGAEVLTRTRFDAAAGEALRSRAGARGAACASSVREYVPGVCVWREEGRRRVAA
jgi:hypothetical protein